MGFVELPSAVLSRTELIVSLVEKSRLHSLTPAARAALTLAHLARCLKDLLPTLLVHELFQLLKQLTELLGVLLVLNLLA